MNITVERGKLIDKGACPKGLEWFDDHADNGVLELDWTKATQVEWVRSKGLHAWLMWAVREALIPAWSMKGADLCKANLSWADLRGANLSYANLIGADLRGANLYGANLHGAKWDEYTRWPEGFTPDA